MNRIKYVAIESSIYTLFHDQRDSERIYAMKRDELIKVRKLTDGKWGKEIDVDPKETVKAFEVGLIGAKPGYENVDEYQITSEKEIIFPVNMIAWFNSVQYAIL